LTLIHFAPSLGVERTRFTFLYDAIGQAMASKLAALKTQDPVPILGVPLLLVTHVLVFRVLMRKEQVARSSVGTVKLLHSLRSATAMVERGQEDVDVAIRVISFSEITLRLVLPGHRPVILSPLFGAKNLHLSFPRTPPKRNAAPQSKNEMQILRPDKRHRCSG
jgi:hypothetical protein